VLIFVLDVKLVIMLFIKVMGDLVMLLVGYCVGVVG